MDNAKLLINELFEAETGQRLTIQDRLLKDEIANLDYEERRQLRQWVEALDTGQSTDSIWRQYVLTLLAAPILG